MIDIDRVRELHRSVTLHRRKGDSLSRFGKDREAAVAYDTALRICDEIIDHLTSSGEAEQAVDFGVSPAAAAEMAETYGVRGGILRRRGQLEDAFASYSSGAQYEDRYGLATYYNRVNAVKVGLIVGRLSYADAVIPLTELRDALRLRLSTDERAADDAWLWADLGDANLLLGDLDAGLSAYNSFAARARTESPLTTVSVLEQIADAMLAHGDPQAKRLQESVAAVRGAFS